MPSRTQWWRYTAQPFVAALLPVVFLTAASAQSPQDDGSPWGHFIPGNPSQSSGYGNHSVWPGQEQRPTRYCNRPGWGRALTGVFGTLPIFGGGSTWPSWSQIPVQSGNGEGAAEGDSGQTWQPQQHYPVQPGIAAGTTSDGSPSAWQPLSTPGGTALFQRTVSL
jgi:hypothetical protein